MQHGLGADKRPCLLIVGSSWASVRENYPCLFLTSELVDQIHVVRPLPEKEEQTTCSAAPRDYGQEQTSPSAHVSQEVFATGLQCLQILTAAKSDAQGRITSSVLRPVAKEKYAAKIKTG